MQFKKVAHTPSEISERLLSDTFYQIIASKIQSYELAQPELFVTGSKVLDFLYALLPGLVERSHYNAIELSIASLPDHLTMDACVAILSDKRLSNHVRRLLLRYLMASPYINYQPNTSAKQQPAAAHAQMLVWQDYLRLAIQQQN